jgi:hypothetical protein
MNRNRFVSDIWQHCIWQLRGSTAERIKQSYSLQTHTSSLLFMFWCCGVHYGRHVTHRTVTQNAEYSFDELTYMILLYWEAERNAVAAARLYAERYPQRWLQIAGHSLLWNVVDENTSYMAQYVKRWKDHEVAWAPIWKKIFCVP